MRSYASTQLYNWQPEMSPDMPLEFELPTLSARGHIAEKGISFSCSMTHSAAFSSSPKSADISAL